MSWRTGSFGYPLSLGKISPLMSDTPPPFLLSKTGVLRHAFKVFPKAVFTQWLRHRRKAADDLCPEWRSAPKRARILLLDRAATIGARFN
jgi:hypothetical protein